MTAHEPAPRPAGSAAEPLLVDALLLDMDGTLVDSGAAVVRSWNTLLAELGSDRTFTEQMHGTPARQVLQDVFPDMGEDEIAAAHSRIEELETADTDGITVLPGTARLLESLDRAGQELGRDVWTIVTSCTRRLFDVRWAVTGLPVPATIVTADQVQRGKPDPEPYLLGARRLGVEPGAALVVEDSLGGLASAAAAGSPAIALTTTTPRTALQGRARAVLASLEQMTVSVAEGRLRVSTGSGDARPLQ